MNKREYISSLVNLIINKVKFHAPNLSDDNLDFSLLDAVGIDFSFPIFVFKKEMNRYFYQAFKIAKKSVKFNLIISTRPNGYEKALSKLEQTYLLYEDEIGSILHYTIDALNINYTTHSDFYNEIKEEYVKVNNQQIELDFHPFFLYKKIMTDGVIYEVSEFLLSGKNYIANFINTKKSTKKINFELNIPLPRGYYYFKKNNNNIIIENLTTKEKVFLNYNLKNIKTSFSTMNGIECCTYACINIKCDIELLPQQTKKLFFNLGEQKFYLKNAREINYFYDLSQKKMLNIFDIQVTSCDKHFDDDFNLSLPRKIWKKWQNWDVDEESENKWLKIRNSIVQKSEKGEQINKDFKGLKEVKFYRNLGWKRVFIVRNNSCYLYADKVKYYNYTLLTKEIFKQNNEIYLSFNN